MPEPVCRPHYDCLSRSCPGNRCHVKFWTELWALHLETTFEGQLFSCAFCSDHKSSVNPLRILEGWGGQIKRILVQLGQEKNKDCVFHPTHVLWLVSVPLRDSCCLHWARLNPEAHWRGIVPHLSVLQESCGTWSFLSFPGNGFLYRNHEAEPNVLCFIGERLVFLTRLIKQ